jgi:hypothetical protein
LARDWPVNFWLGLQITGSRGNGRFTIGKPANLC